MTNAVEKAKEKLKAATSGDEDAFLLAELIHGLGLQSKSAEFTALANGQDPDTKHITECEERIVELWKKADDDGIRRAVEDALTDVQATWRRRVTEPTGNGAG